ncbi:MAG: hypothetical protein Q9N02_10205, partial [Ghiorsea sp.]|nr:hypothetical protein [Ghiorsea sp.]
MKSQIDRIDDYELKYKSDYAFEHVMVLARQKHIESLIREKKPAQVLEVGCGLEQLFHSVEDCEFIKKWTIVEPADDFFAVAGKINDKRVNCIQGFIEDVVTTEHIEKVDMCICSGLLHEISSPEIILNAVKNLI